jgi:hypothetical protein
MWFCLLHLCVRLFGGERAEEEIGESGVSGSVVEGRPLAQRYCTK